ncbi:MAG: hypothetical protein MUF61_02785, partial [archaeon]|nr:hypothetical protein [archaeon]
LDSFFEVPEKDKNRFIDENVAAHVPEEKRAEVKDRTLRIVGNYMGCDIDALSILGYAAERGKFEEYATKLEVHYTENLQFVHPQLRIRPNIPGAQRANAFFVNCYHELGVMPAPFKEIAIKTA